MAPSWDVDRARLAWWVLAFALAAAVGFVVYSFVGTFVFGVFIYYATRPVHRKLESRVRPPSLAAALALLALAVPVILLVAYTGAIGLQELNRFLADTETLDAYQQVLAPYLDLSRVAQDPAALLAEASGLDAVRGVLADAANYLGFLGNAALHLFVMVGIAFYLLRDDHRLAAWFHRRFDDSDGVVRAYVRQVDRDFNNIFFGNILNAAITGVIGAVAYNALAYAAPPGVAIPYPTLLGLLTGVASLVPVVGMKLVYVPIAAYLTVVAAGTDPELLWFPAAFAGISFVVVDVIPDLVLRPYVSGRGLHVGMVMFAYIFGPLLWGWYGVFLGPMLLVLVVHFARLVLPELLAGRPVEPAVLAREIRTAGGDADPPVDAAAAGDAPTADADGPDADSTPGPSPDDASSG
jgi:predicted PurR-regulated permease PerM